MLKKLYHISEEPGIALFEPRTSPQHYEAVRGDVVFAIAEEMLHLYLTSRDCPRVCYMTGPDSSREDIATIPTGAKAVLAVEHYWEQALRETPLYIYELPVATFESLDANAGYYISYKAVKPFRVRRVDNPLQLLSELGVAVVYVPDLWIVADRVMASTLRFSCIRMRNAAPRGSI